MKSALPARAAIKPATIFVVDDNSAIREAVSNLLGSLGHRVESFVCAEDFIDQRESSDGGCLILDVRLPGMSGLELQRQLNESRDRIPIIFITGHGDVPMAVQSMKAGAIDFLLKPLRDQDLLEAVQTGLRRDRTIRTEQAKVFESLQNFRRLTEREREIMDHVVTGRINKQIAAAIGISDVTVKIHRAHVMQKMGTASLAELVRVADLIRAYR